MNHRRLHSAWLWLAGAALVGAAAALWFYASPRPASLHTAAAVDPPPSAATRPSDPHTLRIITANVRYADPADGVNAWPNRRAFLVATLQAQNPDLIGCQEVTPAQATYLINELHGFAFLPNAHDSPPATSLFSTSLLGALDTLFYRADRFDLLATADGPLRPDAPQPNATENAFYTLAVLADRDHNFPDLIVIDTHLRHGVPNATIGAQKIHALIAAQRQRYPHAQAVVLGDMNHARGTPVYAALIGPPDDPLTDTFDYTQKPANERWGTYHAFTGRPTADLPSDLIFVTPLLKFTPATILRDHTPPPPPQGRYPSDHFFVQTILTAP